MKGQIMALDVVAEICLISVGVHPWHLEEEACC